MRSLYLLIQIYFMLQTIYNFFFRDNKVFLFRYLIGILPKSLLNTVVARQFRLVNIKWHIPLVSELAGFAGGDFSRQILGLLLGGTGQSRKGLLSSTNETYKFVHVTHL